MSEFIPYGKQLITEEDIQAVVEVLKSPFITQGPTIKAFEDKLCELFDCKYAVAVNSGTAALHAAYFALGLSKGDEFITTPNTFVATSNAGLYLGATPVFADIESDTGNIDVAKIEALITDNTKLLAPVHYAGHPVDLEGIQQLAQKRNLHVVEDASHAIGANYKGSKIGACKYSDITTFSFHPVKHIATGEGGAVLTNDADLYEKVMQFRTHGITKNNMSDENAGPWYYEMQFLGFNYRITDIQARLGLSQLSRIEENIKRRQEIYKRYHQAFTGNDWFDLPPERDYAQSAWHLFPIRLKNTFVPRKVEIFQKLFENKIGVQTHYIPVHTQPFYRANGFEDLSLPVAEDFYAREISIPMYHALSKDDQQRVVETIQKVFSEL